MTGQFQKKVCAYIPETYIIEDGVTQGNILSLILFSQCSQLNISVSPIDSSTQFALIVCLSDIYTWMGKNLKMK